MFILTYVFPNAVQDLSSETEIRAANGNNFKALDVFSHALKFFRNHAIQEIGFILDFILKLLFAFIKRLCI